MTNHIILRIFLIFFLTSGALKIAEGQSVTVSFERIRELQLDEKSVLDVSLNNRTGQRIMVVYKATVNLMGLGKVLDIQSVPMELGPGSRLLSTYARSNFNFTYTNPDFRAIKDITGNFPAGNYELCAELEIMTDPPSAPVFGCRELYKPSNFNLLLLTPEDGSVIEPEFRPHFSWSAVSTEAGIVRRLSYVFKLSEKLSHQRNEEAIKRNPHLVNQNGLDNPMFLYPSNARILEEDKSYVWQIDAYFGRIYLGSSEVWSFNVEQEKPVLLITPTTSYINIATALGQAELYFYESIKFGYNVSAQERTIKYSLFRDGDDEVLLQDTVALRPGENRVDISIRDLSLKHLGDYILEVEGNAGLHRLTFKYLNPNRIK